MAQPLAPAQLARLQPAALLAACRAAATRPGRPALHHTRPIHTLPEPIAAAHASALVSRGDTAVLCALTLETAVPDPAAPTAGFLVPNIDLGPMCCPRFRAGPPNDQAQILAARLNDLLLGSRFVPLDALAIEPRKAVWVLYLDIVCLANDGNLFDAVVAAAVATLRSARIPVVAFDPDRQKVVLAHPTAPQTVPLPTGPPLTAHTFALFDSGTTILPDPSLAEEDLAHGSLSLVLDPARNIHALSFVAPPQPDAQLPAILDACLAIIHKNPPSPLP
ncbi:hypothetical protein PTTG_30564 [Puccinia triticina 1-1 BBBD Race 1]|uniref:Ribosomal RNA-processing protein 43 n=1 Tax=Puccinia triticina (isolate 1-1 / race 1 (BBBD)) TaxID=630390 RepID=A0A180FYB4_PUCT1|nr:hypothetical protein PTTG_30564 [Puccinia triticina 1-1 BBBD Race 1]